MGVQIRFKPDVNTFEERGFVERPFEERSFDPRRSLRTNFLIGNLVNHNRPSPHLFLEVRILKGLEEEFMEVRIVKDLAERGLAGGVDSKGVIETRNARLLEVRILKGLRVRSPDVQITKDLRWLKQGFDTSTWPGQASAEVAKGTEKRKVSGKTGSAREREGGE